MSAKSSMSDPSAGAGGPLDASPPDPGGKGATPQADQASTTAAAEKAGTGQPDRDRKPLSPAARRALAEAEERRRRAEAERTDPVPEKGGRGGPDPARYGDWEIKGRAIDF